jgi:hypothetical protein
MPGRKDQWFPDEFDRGSGGSREGQRGLEPDYGGVGATHRYRGGSWVDQRDAAPAPGPYVGLGPKGYTRSDAAIHEDVCDRLMSFGYVDATDIDVSVSAGEVILAGWVDDRDQKRLAEDIADRVPGVLDVHNRVRVRRRFGGMNPEDESERRQPPR